MHRDKKIYLRIVAISASERKSDGTYAYNFSEFEKRITDVGIKEVEVLDTFARADVSKSIRNYNE